MTKRNDSGGRGERGRRGHRDQGRVGEPVQVYLARPDRDRLERLAAQLDASKSEVLRRGLAALESLSRTEGREVRAPRPELPTERGGGLQPGVDLDDSSALLDLMEGRDAAP